MRIFTFFLMMTVAIGGTLVGYRSITGRDLVSLDDLGLIHSATSPGPTAGPREAPVATVPPSPTPAPTPPPATPTPVPDTPQTMFVGNTDGQGVFVRRTPRLEDRLRAWRDGTRMEILGRTIEAEGRKWRKVRAPDGAEGYIPEEFLVDRP